MVDPVIKFHLIGHANSRAAILEVLEKSGAVELVITDPTNSGTTVSAPDVEIEKARAALSVLQKYSSTKRGLIASFLPEKVSLSQEQFMTVIDRFKDGVFLTKIGALSEEYHQVSLAVAQCHEGIKELANWVNLDFEQPAAGAMGDWQIVFGSLPAARYLELIQLTKHLEQGSELLVGSEDERSVYVAIILNHQEKSDYLKKAQELNFELEDTRWQETPRLEIERLNAQLVTLRARQRVLHAKLLELAKSESDLRVYLDFLQGQTNLAIDHAKLTNTNRTFNLTGWLPERIFTGLKVQLEAVTKNFEIGLLAKDENEEPPVIMRNSSWAAPFEAVTKIYGLPRSNEPDPTPWLAPFFAIFFGLALTDAGYGLLMLALIPLLKKALKIKGEAKLFKVLFIGGFTTTIMGAIFGTWFGMSGPSLPNFLGPVKTFLASILILDPSKDPINFLILMFALGFVHILVGLVVKIWWRSSHQDWRGALLDQGVWMATLVAIAVWIATMGGLNLGVSTDLAKNIVLLGLLALVLTQGRSQKNIIMKPLAGILSLYGFIGYLSDILSYSRLLALGLATGIVGLVVNLIAGIFRDMIPVPGLNWVVFGMVFVGGHAFNIAINALGGFIHSSRLQFVEFFPKFMEGGGRAFRPLGPKYQYVEITDE